MLSDRLRIQTQHRFPELVLSAQVLLNCGGGGTCNVRLLLLCPSHLEIHGCTTVSISMALNLPVMMLPVALLVPAIWLVLSCLSGIDSPFTISSLFQD